ncbi:unnamed protein product [Ectocarpus fasciculatus]
MPPAQCAPAPTPGRKGQADDASTVASARGDFGGDASEGSTSTSSSSSTSNNEESSSSSSSTSSSTTTNTNSSSSSSSSDEEDGDSGNSSSSSNNSGTDFPVLGGLEGRRLAFGGKPFPLQAGSTRSRSKQFKLSANCAEALLDYAANTCAVTDPVVLENMEESLVHESSDDRRVLEEGARAFIGEVESPAEGLVEHNPTYGEDGTTTFALASDNLPELSIRSPIGLKPNDVELPPTTYEDVQKSEFKDGWEAAMQVELEGHKKTGTFHIVDKLPEGRKAVGSKWVLGWKTDEKGEIVKFKARLVARGFSQVRDVDYSHSSSPCPSAASIKLLLALANEKGMKLSHWDVKQAYIHAKLKEEVYMKLPPGCGSMSGKFAKLERALYGLKQSGREWGYEAADTLTENGFEQSRADPCIFRKMVDGVVKMIIAIYVDDLLVAGSEEECDALLASLNKKFPTNDLGECTWYDGCGIERDLDSGTLTISQSAYVESMMKRFDVMTTSPIPASPGVDLGPKRDDEPGGNWPVREAVGSMMWVAIFTRPDIANALRAVARHAHAPAERHWRAALKILEYLNGTRNIGITYARGSGLDLEVYVDSSYADASTNRRSVTGIAVTIGGTVISHASKTQPVVAMSTSEAEYIAGAEGVKESLFVRNVLSFMAPETCGASIKVLEDNQGAIALIENPLSSARSKHIDVRYHFIRGLFRSKAITVEYVPTAKQHADLLTKALSRKDLEYHRRRLMNLPK